MANINSIQDDNQVYSLLGATGTAGTAQAIRLVADANGNLGVFGTVTSSVSIGTVPEITNIVGGTITRLGGGSIVVTSGTIASMNSIGTVGVINDGTVAIKGTVPVTGSFAIGTIDSVTNIAGGTISVLNAGSVVMTAGTVSTLNTVGTVGVLNAGSVAVTSVVPGTGATNLGKARANAAGTADVGVMVLGVNRSTDLHAGDLSDGQYAMLSLTDFREVRTRDQRTIDLANCNTGTADYSVLNAASANIGVSTNHVFGTAALTVDKVSGTSVFGGASKDLGTVNVAEIFESGGFVGMSVYLSSLTNVVNTFLRVGTDATNYNCWTWPVADLTAATWLNLRKAAAQPDYTKNAGNGWNPTALKYVAFGVEFAGTTDTLAGMLFDHVHIVGGRVTATDLSAAITSSVTTPNINLHRVGGQPTDVGNGTTGPATLRVTVASDSTGKVNVGTVSSLTAGSIVMTAGTVSTLNTVGTVGVLNAGSVVVTNGTIASVGTVPGVGVVASVTNLAGGTIGIITAGTITPSTTVRTISAGTVIVGGGTITTGTIASVGTVPGVGIVGNINGGSIVVTNGTVASVGTVPGVGVVGAINAGSVVVTNGTVALKNAPVTQILTAMAYATAGGSAFGTLSAASGAGTAHVVSGLQIVVHSGTVDCYLGFGTALTGGSVLARGNFVPSAGIVRDFSLPIQSGTNSEICWELAGAGTASFAVNYCKV